MQESTSRLTMPENPSTSRIQMNSQTARPTAEEPLSLLLDWEPWYKEFYRQLKDLVRPQKLPPLQLTSKPIPVKDMWADYRKTRLATPTSVLVHILVIAILAIPFGTQAVELVKKNIIYS